MKHVFFLLAVFAIIAGLFGCSDKNNPVSQNKPANTSTSIWNDTDSYWRTTVDASSYSDFKYFSFSARDTVTPDNAQITNPLWDMGFRREVIKLNGGASSINSGNAIGFDLGVVDFQSVTSSDTSGKSWVNDQIAFFIDNWYSYNSNTHQLTPTRNVYSMIDAGGHNYIKFQIDSFPGAGMPPNMGTIWMTYYYQPTADSKNLPGPTVQVSIPVGTGTTYFDFSSGSVVMPADPLHSIDWDLAFNSYNIMQNSGPNGIGACAAFFAYTELTDPTDINGFILQPVMAPMFADIPSSALTDWYNYTGAPLHQLLSKNHVYLIKSSGKLYKLMIESYYANVGGVATSGHYTFIWKEL